MTAHPSVRRCREALLAGALGFAGSAGILPARCVPPHPLARKMPALPVRINSIWVRTPNSGTPPRPLHARLSRLTQATWRIGLHKCCCNDLKNHSRKGNAPRPGGGHGEPGAADEDHLGGHQGHLAPAAPAPRGTFPTAKIANDREGEAEQEALDCSPLWAVDSSRHAYRDQL